MEELKQLLFIWNDWIVLPTLTLLTILLHYRYRKQSTLVLCLGMSLLLVSHILNIAYPHPLSYGYLVGIFFGVVGLFTSIFGALWFFRKDYAKKQSLTHNSSATPNGAP